MTPFGARSSDFVNIAGAEILGEAPGEPRVLAGASACNAATFLFRERAVEERQAVDLAIEAVDRRTDRTDRAGREEKLVEVRSRAVEKQRGLDERPPLPEGPSPA